jgi:hypothetical protein
MYADRVKDTTLSTGTGAITLAGVAPTGYQTFAAGFGASAVTVSYCIADQTGNNWEVGVGTFDGTTGLTRTTVLGSSNAGAPVAFTAGTKDVFCTAPAQYLDTFTSTNQGVVPASGGGTANFLRADGTFAAPTATAPASPTTSVQFNNAGAFGASPNFTYNTGTNTFTVGPAGATTIIETLAPTGSTIAGTMRFRGKNASATNGAGGGVSFLTGNGLGTGAAGVLSISTGSSPTGKGGDVTLLTGPTSGAGNSGGDFNIELGSGNSAAAYGGSFFVNSGTGNLGQDQNGTFYILGGGGGTGGTFAMGCGASTIGVGGDITFAMSGGATDDGNIYIQEGLGRNFIHCRNETAGGGPLQIGFFNATPVVQQASAPVATNLANAITLVNALRTALLNLGLIV